MSPPLRWRRARLRPRKPPLPRLPRRRAWKRRWLWNARRCARGETETFAKAMRQKRARPVMGRGPPRRRTRGRDGRRRRKTKPDARVKPRACARRVWDRRANALGMAVHVMGVVRNLRWTKRRASRGKDTNYNGRGSRRITILSVMTRTTNPPGGGLPYTTSRFHRPVRGCSFRWWRLGWAGRHLHKIKTAKSSKKKKQQRPSPSPAASPPCGGTRISSHKSSANDLPLL